MKKTLATALIALAVVFLVPSIGNKPYTAEDLPEVTLPPAEEDSSCGEHGKPQPYPLSAAEAVSETAAAPSSPEKIYLLCDGEIREMDREEYITGVVAAEMPAAFSSEALKAQAVAARSYALYCAGLGKHGGADVCSDPGCCQAWLSKDEMKNVWGRNYRDNLSRVSAAVKATEGEYLIYGGEAIFAAFHSSSAGATEDSGAIWNSLPYLVSVDSPESEKTVPDYVSYVQCTPLDFRDTVLYAEPGADFTGPETLWIGEIHRNPSGRVEYAVLGGTRLSGTELRKLFSLRSAAFDIEYSEGRFLFTVTGFGHGVGMSQYGADTMADGGADYREILSHYYPGAELIK